MIFTRKETEYTFNDRPFCNYDDKEITYSIYKCSKCIYENKIVECSSGGGSHYVSKKGFGGKRKTRRAKKSKRKSKKSKQLCR